jgi:hypothetical protein
VSASGIGRGIERGIAAEIETGRGTAIETTDTEDTTILQVAEIRLATIQRSQLRRLSPSYPRMRLSGLSKKLLMIY